MSVERTFRKDPDATLDYELDWSSEGWLAGDTIASASWTVPAGITKVTDSTTTTISTVWLSGGTLGTDYIITCHITTAGGRQDDRSLRIQVRSR